jgi:hypothetical protein
MNEGNYRWKCTNRYCGATNEIPRQRVHESIANNKVLVLVCRNCGYASNRDESSNPEPENSWLPCVKWNGPEQREPLGLTPAGWISAEGEQFLTTKQFLLKYGINPEINWRWRSPYIRSFGDPTGVLPRRSNCSVHGQITSGRIIWQKTEPHCPDCGRKLEYISSD